MPKRVSGTRQQATGNKQQHHLTPCATRRPVLFGMSSTLSELVHLAVNFGVGCLPSTHVTVGFFGFYFIKLKFEVISHRLRPELLAPAPVFARLLPTVSSVLRNFPFPGQLTDMFLVDVLGIASHSPRSSRIRRTSLVQRKLAS